MSDAPSEPVPRRLWHTGALLAVAVAVWAALVVTAPLDSVQGVIQKILYVHVPCAFASYLGFAVTGVCSALYLWKHDERYDRVALSSAEVGVIFCTLMLVTGPIWGRGTWGKWWSWDPRLTVTLLLWFVYLAYLLLRSFSEGGERTARFASVYGVVGVLLIPINYYVIEIFQSRAMHPENLKSGSLGEGMGLPFLMGILTLLSAFFHLLVSRWEVESLRARVAREAGEQESLGEEFA